MTWIKPNDSSKACFTNEISFNLLAASSVSYQFSEIFANKYHVNWFYSCSIKITYNYFEIWRNDLEKCRCVQQAVWSSISNQFLWNINNLLVKKLILMLKFTLLKSVMSFWSYGWFCMEAVSEKACKVIESSDQTVAGFKINVYLHQVYSKVRKSNRPTRLTK